MEARLTELAEASITNNQSDGQDQEETHKSLHTPHCGQVQCTDQNGRRQCLLNIHFD